MNQIVRERQATHGDFLRASRMSQEIKAAMFDDDYVARDLAEHRREALEMIAVKMARIMCGDDRHVDHWADIAGYAALGKLRADGEPPLAEVDPDDTLRSLLRECAKDLEAHVERFYQDMKGYPEMNRRYQRDMAQIEVVKQTLGEAYWNEGK